MRISTNSYTKVRVASKNEAATYFRQIADDIEQGKILSFKGKIGIDGVDGELEIAIPQDYLSFLSNKK